MKKEKQIEEMARDIHFATCNDYISYSECEHIAKQLTDKGYRKEQEVAKQIFEEEEKDLNDLIAYYKEKRKYATEVDYNEFEQRFCDIKIKTFEERLLKLTELKKKYIGE